MTTMEKLAWVIAVVGIVGISLAGGVYTAQRTGSVIAGLVCGVAFAAIFGTVLFRAARAHQG